MRQAVRDAVHDELAAHAHASAAVDDDPQRLLSLTDTAKRLGVSRSQVYTLIQSHELPAIKVGDVWRVPVDGLRAWITRQLVERTK
ncbi:MAG TPA: helix-turn-helix domain-containing protein [Vicinamibacterales bacterium]|nr:helix-turn-helix domain-containing protein [Vicinamibacterales bacterium]